MKRLKFALSLLLLLIAHNMYSQSVETGFVKQYNGKETKTPISGVEIYASGASSTATDENGAFNLRFNTLKAGDKISNPEIYKEGYIVFNKDAVNVWRISNKKSPFNIIMCKEQQFRELKRKYYGLLNDFYQKDYTNKCNQVKSLQYDKNKLSEKLDSLERDYKKKLENIESYVDMFSRLDRESIDKNMEDALSLLEAGKIDEAIKKYEALELTKHSKEQLKKWEAGAELIRSGEKLQSESFQDMVALSVKLKQQIAAYEIGGSNYVDKKLETLNTIITLYRVLCSKSDTIFQKDLAECLCQKGDLLLHDKDRMKCYRESADLGSYRGWLALGEMYENLVYQKRSNVYLDSMRTCYSTSMKMTPENDTLQLAKEHLQKVYDFFVPNEKGDTLYYKIVDSEEVSLHVRCNNCYNIVDSILVIPDIVNYNGHSYRVSSISSQAFAYNHKLRKVIVGKYCKAIASDAFEECNSLSSIVIQNNNDFEKYNMPDYVEIVLLRKLSKDDSDKIKSLLYDRMLRIETNTLTVEKKKTIVTTTHMYESLLEHSEYLSSNDSLEIIMNIASLYRKDTELKNLQHSIALYDMLATQFDDERIIYSKIDCLREKQDFTSAYNILDKFDKSSRYTKMLRITLKNSEAYSYAQKNDFISAHRIIDEAIAMNDTTNKFFDFRTDLYDSKGEFYLMENKTDSAIIYRDKIVAIDSTFVVSHRESVLFNKLGSNNEYDFLRHCVNIIQDVEREIYNKSMNEATNGYRSFSYEEQVSIGIICVQAYIDGKTWEELSEINDDRLSDLIRYVTLHELRFRKSAYRSTSMLDYKNKKTQEMMEQLKSNDYILHAIIDNKETGIENEYVVLRLDSWTYNSAYDVLVKTLIKDAYDIAVLIPLDSIDLKYIMVTTQLKKGDIKFSVKPNENNMRQSYSELYEKYLKE